MSEPGKNQERTKLRQKPLSPEDRNRIRMGTALVCGSVALAMSTAESISFGRLSSAALGGIALFYATLRVIDSIHFGQQRAVVEALQRYKAFVEKQFFNDHQGELAHPPQQDQREPEA